MGRNLLLFSNSELTALKKILQSAGKELSPEPKKDALFSMDEVRKMFFPVISRMIIYKWIDDKKLPVYPVNGKQYFKYQEVAAASQLSGRQRAFVTTLKP
jgi:hypothetical protein